MATWSTALADLRTFLCDTDRDHLVKDKEVLGRRDGQNRTFYTFDDRLVASGNQSVCGRPLEVYENGVEISASGILITDQFRGEFQMMYVPSGNVKLTASYYYQEFIDDELNLFLTQARHLVNVSDITEVPEGLQMAVLNLAAAFGHQRLAMRWQERKLSQFGLHEAPALDAEATQRVQYHRDQAQWLRQEGVEMRRSYYDLRHDRGRQPAFGILKRGPAPWGPRR